jgi:hypothetical protein
VDEIRCRRFSRNAGCENQPIKTPYILNALKEILPYILYFSSDVAKNTVQLPTKIL